MSSLKIISHTHLLVMALTLELHENLLVSCWTFIIFQALCLNLIHFPNGSVRYSILNITISIYGGGKWSLKQLGRQRKITLPSAAEQLSFLALLLTASSSPCPASFFFCCFISQGAEIVICLSTDNIKFFTKQL